jgi:hypothetical protein
MVRRDEMRRVVEELSWHTDQPKVAYEATTEKERRDILKRGYVTKELWRCIAVRLPRVDAVSEG